MSKHLEEFFDPIEYKTSISCDKHPDIKMKAVDLTKDVGEETLYGLYCPICEAEERKN